MPGALPTEYLLESLRQQTIQELVRLEVLSNNVPTGNNRSLAIQNIADQCKSRMKT